MSTMSTLFISHGAPDIILSDHPALDAMRNISAGMNRPRGIVIVSAHWTDNPVGITSGRSLPTIHDFGGFPDELYAVQYPANGSEALSDEVAQRLAQYDLEYKLHEERGLDHGAWIPLSIMYPEADIPVVQVSLPAASLKAVAQLGAALAPLRHTGVLIIGSGGSVHNLRALNVSGETESWVLEFEQWLLDAIEGRYFDRLITHASFPDIFHQAHPTIEHYAPLVFAWAAAGLEQPARRVHHSFSYGNLGMAMFEFGQAEIFKG